MMVFVSLDHLSFDDGVCLPFGIPSQKGGVLCRVFVFRGRVLFPHIRLCILFSVSGNIQVDSIKLRSTLATNV